jgi:hypothetical protein
MPDRRAAAAALLRQGVAFESAMWRSLFRWLLRRRRVLEPEGQAFGYTSVVMPLLLAFVGVSAIELPVVHLIVPWTGPRIALDIVGVYGLLWMVGLLAMLRVNPHVVSGAGLRVRSGTTVDMTIPWDYVAAVRELRHTVPARPRHPVERSGDSAVLHLAVMSQTNVDIQFVGPTTVPLAHGESEPLTGLRIAADDPGALVAMARRQLKHRSARRDTPAT